MRESRLDGGEADAPEWAVTWERVGRELLRREVTERRIDLEEAFYDVEDCLRDGEEVTPDHVHALREALNRARERVENELAPVAGVEPWGDPPPRIPMGVLREQTGHPKAEGVDSRELGNDADGGSP